MRNYFNPKGRIGQIDRAEIESLLQKIRYKGNPEHKKNPFDFGLAPPTCPHPDKTLCDDIGRYDKKKALELLQKGVKRGLVSEQRRGQFPQNIWAVTDSGVPVEFHIGDHINGCYH